MQSLAELLEKKKSEETPKFRSQRAELLSKLYFFYERDYKRQAWKEYDVWLKKNKLKHTRTNLENYRKVMYPKVQPKSFYSFWLGHIPTDDLYFLVSIAKDKENRRESFNRWLFWALKDEKDKNKV